MPIHIHESTRTNYIPTEKKAKIDAHFAISLRNAAITGFVLGALFQGADFLAKGLLNRVTYLNCLFRGIIALRDRIAKLWIAS